MIYRPLGRTGLALSAVGLGGHWRTPDGERYYDRFADGQLPAAALANRTEVVEVCLDAGINYLDITTAAECVAYGRVLSGRREGFIIGADDYQWSARNRACLKVDALVANVERCLRRLQTDYLDIWRVTSEVHGQNTDAEMTTVIEAAARLRQAGKIRHLGVSSHCPEWISHALTAFDEFEVVLMPTVPQGCGTGELHPPRSEGDGPSSHAALRAFETAQARGVGTIGIKPFAGGLLFASGGHKTSDNDVAARLALRHLLFERHQLTCVAAGMTTPDEARSLLAAAASGPSTAEEAEWLARRIAERLGRLPAEYAWLAAWDVSKLVQSHTEEE